MSKTGFVMFLQDAEPEPDRATKRQANASGSDKPATKTPTRFHTSIYPTSREFYDDVRIALIREGKGRDFNELVNALLAEWLEAHGD